MKLAKSKTSVGLVLIGGLLLAVLVCVDSSFAKTTVEFSGYIAAQEVQKPMFLKMKELFEAENPDIRIEYGRSVPYRFGHEQYWLQVMAGDAPDFGQMDSHTIWDLVVAGALEPLDLHLSEELKAELIPDTLANCIFDGKIMYLPHDVCYLITIGNIKPRREAGFDSPPRTVEEFKEQARKIASLKTQEGKKMWGFTPPTGRGANLGMFILPFLYNAGGREFDEEGKVAINSPEAVDTLNLWKELADEKVLGPIGVSRQEQWVILGTQKTGYTLDNTHAKMWHVAGLGMDMRDYDEYFEASLVPSWKIEGEHRSMAYPTALFVFKQSKHKQEAMKVIEFWMLNREVLEVWNEISGGLPGTKSARQRFTDKYSATVWEGLKWTRLPFHPHEEKFLKLGDLLSIAVQKVLFGEMDAKSALDELADKWETVL